LRWADQLCDALDYLHTQDPQIIHRDIKPQNLKLTARGQIVLLDFGLAKGSAGQMSIVTTSASIFGYTPNYAPLEQVQGLGTDPRSDIYALAATLFHLLTNVKPPDALSRASAIVNGLPDPLPLANVIAHVDPAVAAVLSKGMSQKRDDRFPSAEAMREALRIAAENPLGAAATVLMGATATNATAGAITSEAATKLVGDQTKPLTDSRANSSSDSLGSEAQTLVAADATSVRNPSLTGETATLVQPATRGKRSRAWLGAALLLILITGGAAGFYAYRARKQTQQNSSTTTSGSAPSESSQPAQSEPGKGPQVDAAQVDPVKTSDPKTEKKVDTSQRTATSKQSANKSEPNTPAKEAPVPPAHNTAADSDRNNPNVEPPPQASPQFDPFRNQRGRQPGHPPNVGQTPNVKVLPNGTRIVTQPDGTRIITGPKGRVQVIPPGERPNRKRDRP
jgi:serine/threonine protein kinase